MALLTVSEKVGHYEWIGNDPQYLVWTEDSGSNALHGDNMLLHKAIQGTIDLYVKEGQEPWTEQVEQALNDAKVSFGLNSIQFEEQTGYVHYEWVFEVA